MATKRNPTVIGSFNGMTLNEWRNSVRHVKWMRKMMSDETFRDFLAVLQNLRPATQPDPLVELGMRRGHDMMFAAVLALTEFAEKDQEDIPANYESSPLQAVV